MGVDEADQLEEIIQRSERWPVWSADYAGGMSNGAAPQVGMYGQTAQNMELFIAIRESDRPRIEKLINWGGDNSHRKYKVDPLGERISQAFSDLLFGEDPETKAGDPADEENLTELLDSNDFASELRSAASDASSEGEVYWRCYVDPGESDYPVIEFVSRLDVVPLFRGRKLAAIAFVSVLFTQEIMLEGERIVEYWRHIEIQTDGETRNLLFKGALGELGVREPLENQTETADLPDDWKSGLDFMLAGRVLNKRGRDFRLGVSDYQGIMDLLLDLNEVRVIMSENAKLSGKSRMIVPANAVDSEGKVDLGSDVIVDEGVENFDGGASGRAGVYAVLEYTFQAEQLIAYKDDIVSDAQTRVGLASQFMGGSKSGSEGSATSGTALRTRFIPTVLAGAGKGRYWMAEMPSMLLSLQMLDSMPQAQGGCGHSWTKADEAPSVTLASVLPEDPSEAVDLRVTSVAGEIESVEAAVRKQNPDFTDEQVAEELAKIKADRTSYGIGEKTGAAGDEAEQDGLGAMGG